MGIILSALAFSCFTLAADNLFAQSQPAPTRVVLAPLNLDQNNTALSDSLIGLTLAYLDTLSTTRDLKFVARQDVNTVLRQSAFLNGLPSAADLKLLARVLSARNSVGISVERRPMDYRIVSTFMNAASGETSSVQFVSAMDLPAAAQVLAFSLAGQPALRR